MRHVTDEQLRAFAQIVTEQWWTGTRIKDVRATPLTPGGRARLTLFEQVDGGGRPHPRLQVAMPLAEDPTTPEVLFETPDPAPTDSEGFDRILQDQLGAKHELLGAFDVAVGDAGPASPLFARNTVRGARTRRFFDEADACLEGLLQTGGMPAEQAAGCRFALRSRRDLAFVGPIRFDDDDTGTYHSFQHDDPFVHYLEALTGQLPEEGTDALALLDADQRQAVRRQRRQTRCHLDHLMRHKYADEGVVETDIERSVGGFLIDRQTRMIVSETKGSAGSLVPAYELLRVEPGAEHADAGAWVYRDGQGGLRRQDHAEIQGDPPLRSVPKQADDLTFARAPGDADLRAGVRFDWNGDGYVQDGPIDWISWAGHCDIKAVVEQLGVTLTWQPAPSVREYRSDTDQVTHFDRDLLLEMLCSALELGSIYQLLDGSGRIQRGVHRFGGARNDSLPDRLQFLGPEEGSSFRWPLGGRRSAFVITRIEQDGQPRDVNELFLRLHPDPDRLDFAANPRFLRTVDGDCNLIDVSGTVVQATMEVDTIDPSSGYLTRSTETTTLDLRPDASPGRDLLGTHVKSPQERTLYRVWLERGEEPAMVAELERWEQGDEGWVAVALPDQTVRMPLVAPLSVTLSREMKRDNPEVFQELLDVAIRQGVNINADTSAEAEVWNGTVMAIENQRTGVDREARTEQWRVAVTARFGKATLEYLLRRDEEGRVQDYCPLAARWGQSPDFLWQDFPDVASKGVEQGDWVVNEAMVEREIVELEWQPTATGGVYVHDDHIKNVFELLFCGLGGYPFTIMHGNKRWGFGDRDSWEAARSKLSALRAALVATAEDQPEAT
jgi:hypothetical protein